MPGSRSEFKNSSKVHANVFLDNNNSKVASPAMAHNYAEIAKSGMPSSSSTFKNKKADWDAEAACPRASAQAAAHSTWPEVAQAQPTPKDELVSDLRAKGVKVTVADEPSSIVTEAEYRQHDDDLPRWADPDCQEYDPDRVKPWWDALGTADQEVHHESPPSPIDLKMASRTTARPKSPAKKTASPSKAVTPPQSPIKKAIGAIGNLFKLSSNGAFKQPPAKSTWGKKSPPAPPVVSPVTVPDVTKVDQNIAPLDLTVDVNAANSNIEPAKYAPVVVKAAEVDISAAPASKSKAKQPAPEPSKRAETDKTVSAGAPSPSSSAKVILQEPFQAPVGTKKAKKSKKSKTSSARASPPAPEVSSDTHKSTDAVAASETETPVSEIVETHSAASMAQETSVSNASRQTSAAAKKKSKKSKKTASSATAPLVSKTVTAAAVPVSVKSNPGLDAAVDTVVAEVIQNASFTASADDATHAGQDTVAEDASTEADKTASTSNGLTKNQRRNGKRKEIAVAKREAAVEELKAQKAAEEHEASIAAEEREARLTAFNVNFTDNFVQILVESARESAKKASFPSDLRAAADRIEQTQKVFKDIKSSLRNALLELSAIGIYPDMGAGEHKVTNEYRLKYGGKLTKEHKQLILDTKAKMSPLVVAYYDLVRNQRCKIKLDVDKRIAEREMMTPPQASEFNFEASSSPLTKKPVFDSIATVVTKTPEAIGWSSGVFIPTAETQPEVVEEQPLLFSFGAEATSSVPKMSTFDFSTSFATTTTTHETPAWSTGVFSAAIKTQDDGAEKLISPALKVPEASDPEQITAIEHYEEPAITDVFQEGLVPDSDPSVVDADQDVVDTKGATETIAEDSIQDFGVTTDSTADEQDTTTMETQFGVAGELPSPSSAQIDVSETSEIDAKEPVITEDSEDTLVSETDSSDNDAQREDDACVQDATEQHTVAVKDTSKFATVTDCIDDDNTTTSDIVVKQSESCSAVMKYHGHFFKPASARKVIISPIVDLIKSYKNIRRAFTDTRVMSLKSPLGFPVPPAVMVFLALLVTSAFPGRSVLPILPPSKVTTTIKALPDVDSRDLIVRSLMLSPKAYALVEPSAQSPPTTPDTDIASPALTEQAPEEVPEQTISPAAESTDALDTTPPRRPRSPNELRMNIQVGTTTLREFLRALPRTLNRTFTRAHLMQVSIRQSNAEREMLGLGAPHPSDATDVERLFKVRRQQYRIYLGTIQLAEFIALLPFDQNEAVTRRDVFHAFEKCAEMEAENLEFDMAFSDIPVPQ